MCNTLIPQSVSDGNIIIRPDRSLNSYFTNPVAATVDEIAAAIESGRSLHASLDRLTRLLRPLPRGAR